MKPSDQIILNDTVTQRDRELEGLAEGFAKVDDRSFEDLLDFGVKYAGIVKFYDLNNEPVGTWTEFFMANPVALMATVLSVDADRLVDADQDDALALRDELKTQWALWRASLESLSSNGEWGGFRSEMLAALGDDDASDDICGQVRRLQSTTRLYFPDGLSRDDHAPQLALYMAFCRLFRTAQRTVNTVPERLIEFYYRDVLQFTDTPARADDAFLTFKLAESEDVRRGVVAAGTLFPAGTDENGDDILFGATSRLAVSQTAVDRVCALQVIDRPLGERILEDDIESGSSDHGQHHHHHPHPTPTPSPCPTPSPLDMPVRSLVIQSEKAAGWIDNPDEALMPLFGATEVPARRPNDSSFSQLGFALSSQALHISGGQRSVTICLTANFEGPDNPSAASLKVLSDATGATEGAVLKDIIQGAFCFEFSTADAWVECTPCDVSVMEVEPYEVRDVPVGAYLVELQLSLGPEFPPVSGFSPEAVESGASSAQVPQTPTVRALLRQKPVRIPHAEPKYATYPYAILEGMSLSQASIELQVSKLPNALLSSSDGELDPSNPFALFGSEPNKGAYLDIGHSELFVKRIDTLSVTLDWFELPSTVGGFQTYYQYYEIDPAGDPLEPKYDNSTFVCAFEVINPGRWTLDAPTTSDLPLYCSTDDPQENARDVSDETPASDLCDFRTVTPDGILCPSSCFADFEISDGPAGPHYSPDDSSLRLTLTGPQYGYGSLLFTPNVLKSVLAELPDGKETQEDKCVRLCAEADPIWTDVIGLLERGVSEGKSKKGWKYLSAILPSVVDANLMLYECYQSHLELIPQDARDPKLEKMGRQLGSFERVVHSNAERNHLMLDSFRRWQEEVDHALQQQGDDLESVLCLQAILEIDIAFGLTLLEHFKDPENAYPAYIDEVILLLRTAEKESGAACMKECMKVKYPLEPYVPWASALRLGYSAKAAVPTSKEKLDKDHNTAELIHLLPSGEAVPVDLSAGVALPILPPLDFQGAVFLRLSRPNPGAAQTLLFDLDGAAGFDWSNNLPAPSWSYLGADGWEAFTPEMVVKDGSDGLQQSGIVELALPNTMAIDVSPEDELPAGWIRAAVGSDAAQFPQLKAVLCNAAIAQRMPDENGVLHYDMPIDSGTIRAPLDPLDAIETVFQPEQSFGGRQAECGRGARTGFSERLRNKNRAVDSWDYERLVLANFPSVEAVKLVPAFNPASSAPKERLSQAGGVLVVVVKGTDGVGASVEPKPIVPQGDIAAIEKALAARASPFAKIMVANPPFAEIAVTAKVRFNASSDGGRKLDQLNDELVEFLSPNWNRPEEPRAKEYWLEGEISNFILNRPYVTELLAISLGCSDTQPGPVFMTSAPAHQLTEYNSVSKKVGGQ